MKMTGLVITMRHTNPVLGLENDAYICWDGKTLKRVRGASWIIEIGKSRFYLG
jgi:hypothetical protein